MYKNWFQMAEGSFWAAGIILQCDDIRVPTGIFQCYRAAEAALKAFLVAKNQSLQKVRDLTELVEICAQFDSDFTCLFDAVKELAPYVKAQYPDSTFVIPSAPVAQHALKQVQTILEFVRNKVD